MYSLSLPLCWPRRLPLWCVVEYIRQLEVRRVTRLTRVVLVFGCGLKRDLVVVVCVVGLVFLFFVAPFSLLAVFMSASVFNQDVSKWNTGAVTDMNGSKCTLSPSLWPRHPLLCILNIDDSSFIGSQFSHVLFFLCCVFDTVPFLLYVVGWSRLFFVAPSLAVFYGAQAFDQDVSKWNTGAVTTMQSSKCTLSSLWPRLPLLCILNIDDSSFIGSQFSHVLFFCFVVLKRFSFVVVWGGLVTAFSLLHPTVFGYASAFNQDVSKWNTGAVWTMNFSKCTLSPSLWPRLPLLCILIYDDSSFIGSHFSHVLFCFIFKCFTTAVSNEHCAVVRGNLSQVQTAHLMILDLAPLV